MPFIRAAIASNTCKFRCRSSRDNDRLATRHFQTRVLHNRDTQLILSPFKGGTTLIQRQIIPASERIEIAFSSCRLRLYPLFSTTVIPDLFDQPTFIAASYNLHPVATLTSHLDFPIGMTQII